MHTLTDRRTKVEKWCTSSSKNKNSSTLEAAEEDTVPDLGTHKRTRQDKTRQTEKPWSNEWKRRERPSCLTDWMTAKLRRRTQLWAHLCTSSTLSRRIVHRPMITHTQGTVFEKTTSTVRNEAVAAIASRRAGRQTGRPPAVKRKHRWWSVKIETKSNPPDSGSGNSSRRTAYRLLS